MKLIKKAKKGFTLIELVVVIAVIAILSAVSVVAYVGITNNAKKSAASQKASQVITTLRAGILASDKGYTGNFDHTEVDGETAEQHAAYNYTITIDNKLLNFVFDSTKITATENGDSAQVKIINDMLQELEEKDLSVNYYEVKDNVSRIGVMPDGKTNVKDIVWVSF